MPNTLPFSQFTKAMQGDQGSQSTTTPQVLPLSQFKAPPVQPKQKDTSSSNDNVSLGGFGQFFKNMGVGIAQSALDTAGGIGKLVGAKPNPFGQKLLNTADKMNNNTAGKTIGNVAGNIAQFFVPGGLEDKAYTTIAEHLDQIPTLLEKIGLGAEKAKTVGSAIANTLKVTTKAGITGASTAGVTAAQTGGNKSQTETSGILGAIGGTVSGVMDVFGKQLGQSLTKSGFKLSPMQEAKAATKSDAASKFMVNNGITNLTDSGKYTKLKNITSKFESILQSGISDIGKAIQVSKKAVIDAINSGIESLKTEDPAIYDTAKNDADKAIKIIQDKAGDTISLEDTLKAKRSYGSAAFRQSKFSITTPGVVSEGSYAVEQALQSTLSNTLDSVEGKIQIPESLQSMFGGKGSVTISDFNKVYSDAINAKNLTGLARFKNDSGLVGRFFGLWVGESLGQVISPGFGGKLGGGLVGELASTRAPGLLRNIATKAATNPDFSTTMTKTGLGAGLGDLFNNGGQ